jgi:2'-5' RNA ligase
MSSNQTERLFFALWLNDEVRQAIFDASQPLISTVQGKVIDPINWHITLAFLGEVDLSSRQCMEQVAHQVAVNAFKISLDKLGFWARNQILWIGASQIPKELLDLVDNLNKNLQVCGYRPESRSFQVHLTLMRKVIAIDKLAKITPISWQIKEFCLVRSVLKPSGAHYEKVARWDLKSIET